MIYTIGIRMKYERAFAVGPVVKRGRGKNPDGMPYPGGFVFATAEDARHFLVSKGLTGTHMVMGALADWEHDTVAHDDDRYRRLIRDAELVTL